VILNDKIATGKLAYLNKWRLFGTPLFGFPPKAWSGCATETMYVWWWSFH